MEWLRGIIDNLRSLIQVSFLPGDCFIASCGKVSTQEVNKYLTCFIRCSYQYNLKQLNGDPARTSDQGWGCMYRATQMLLAYVMLVHNKALDWLQSGRALGNIVTLLEEAMQHPEYCRVLNMTLDHPSSVFSIHSMLRTNLCHSGEWIGPHTAAQICKTIIQDHMDESEKIVCVVAQDSIIYVDKVEAACRTKEWPLITQIDAVDESRSVLILVPLRLGISNLNPEYSDSLFELFRDGHCMGFLGGIPDRALYIVGCAVEGNMFLGLDPHTPSEYNPMEMSEGFPSVELLKRVHTTQVNYVPYQKMDPSLALSFYFRSINEFYTWAQSKMANVLCAGQKRLFTVENCFTAYELRDGTDPQSDEDLVLV